MKPGDSIVAVVPDKARGSGWANDLLFVYIRDRAGDIRMVDIQPCDQTPGVIALFSVAYEVHRAMVGAVQSIAEVEP